MSDVDQEYLTELLTWVQQNEREEGVGEFLAAYASSHGETLYQLAKHNPEDALSLCEMLFEMVEELYDDSEEIREGFLRVQPKPERDKRQLL